MLCRWVFLSGLGLRSDCWLLAGFIGVPRLVRFLWGWYNIVSLGAGLGLVGCRRVLRFRVVLTDLI